MSENESVRISPVPAWIGIILAATWVGAGAVFKLMEAGPNDLPPLFLDRVDAWFNWTTIEAYRWAVTIEIVIVATALIRPRIGWILLALQYVAFLVILMNLQLSGATSCGCFGGVVPVKPLEMISVDAPLLLILLFTKPWKRLPKRAFNPMPWIAIALAAIGALWAPHHFFTTNMDDGRWFAFWETFHEGHGMTLVAKQNPDERPPPGPEVVQNDGDPKGTKPEPPTPPPVDDFVMLDPHSWVDQMIDQTQIGTYFDGDVFALPGTAHVILYRRNCGHCQEHLMELALNPIPDQQVVLIELRADGDEQLTDMIDMKPQTDFMGQLKSLPKGYGLQTPWSFEVEGYIVTSVTDVRSEMGD